MTNRVGVRAATFRAAGAMSRVGVEARMLGPAAVRMPGLVFRAGVTVATVGATTAGGVRGMTFGAAVGARTRVALAVRMAEAGLGGTSGMSRRC
ncbi:hypothetical protein [Actinokineospora iranica]|uniref:hypothetical protein n=1 Tax=Actinokineospora iranica TaxID=1271860 RepID=UPI001113B7DD|nr:hypothetical protein [Actinokineospora iranica]